KLNYERGIPSGLGNELSFKQAQEIASGYGQGFVFVSSMSLRPVLDDFCDVLAANATRPDWVKVRAEITRPVLAKKHPDWVGKPLNHDQEQQLDKDLDAEITRREDEWKKETLPRAAEERRQNLGVLDLFRWAALTVKVNERDLEMHFRLATPAAFQQ